MLQVFHGRIANPAHCSGLSACFAGASTPPLFEDADEIQGHAGDGQDN